MSESGLFKMAVQNQGVQNIGNGNVVAARAEGNGNGNNGNQIRCYNCRGLGHLARNLQSDPRRREAAYASAHLQASTSGTQTDKAPVYDSDGSAEVHNYDNCYDNEIFNMFTQEEQYIEILEPIPEPHQVQQNDNVISDISGVEQEGGTLEKGQHGQSKLKETKADLTTTTELARYKNQEKCFEISQEKYDKLERCYQKSVYQEQCLTKKINALHLSSGMFMINPLSLLGRKSNDPNKVRASDRTTPINRFRVSWSRQQLLRPEGHSLGANTKGMKGSTSALKKMFYSHTANHDVCMLNYVKDMNSRGKKQKANVSNTANQKKQKPKVVTQLGYPNLFMNDREDIRKLGAKGDIGYFIGYSANSCAYIVYNRRTKKIMETMNVTFYELSAMAFEQSSSKPGLQGMTSGTHQFQYTILTYATVNITPQKPTEGSPSGASERENPPSRFIWTEENCDPIVTCASTSINSKHCGTQECQRVYDPTPSMDWNQCKRAFLQFKRLDVRVLVPLPDNIKTSTLKWYRQRGKAKIFGRILRLVARMEAIRKIIGIMLLHKSITVVSNVTSSPSHYLQVKEGIIWVKASTKGMVYVDDIIFGSTHPRYTQLFSDLYEKPLQNVDDGGNDVIPGLTS
ncbi:hypothetical protein Tco_1362625 [Tanacetum coccineum]